VIFCNGDSGNMGHLVQYAKEFAVNGYNSVTFDWRGFGESGHWDTDKDRLVYTEYLLDYNAVLDEIIKLEEVDKNKIGIYGFSTGAYLSFAVSFQRPEIKALAVRALLTNFDSVIETLRLKNRKETFTSQMIIPINSFR